MIRLLAAVAVAGCAARTCPPVATPGIDAVLAGFDHHDIVAIAERHRSAETHLFLRSLIADPRFADRVNDVIVEFASARSQPVLDRYIAGGDIGEREVDAIVRGTTQLLAWDAPVYRELLALIRELNRGRPPDRRIRVIAGEPAIDWTRVRTADDYRPFAARDPDTTRIIRREVLERGRKGLLVLGGAHLTRVDPLAAARGRPGSPSVTQLLERAGAERVYTIWTMIGARAPSVSGIPIGHVRDVSAAGLGERPFGELMPPDTQLVVQVDGKPTLVPIDTRDWPRIEQVVDAVLYLGAVETESTPPARIYGDPAYVAELRRRAAILRDVFGMDLVPDIEALAAAAATP